jgi:hypothetical protein
MSPAGYSGTPLWKKLGLKEGRSLLIRGAPPGWSLPEAPAGISVGGLKPDDGECKGAAEEVAIAFFGARAELAEALPGLSRRIFPEAALWIAWPRRAGGHESDIREQDIRDLALPLGLVDVKVAAIDEDWSGLRLVWRRELRDAPAPGPPGSGPARSTQAG